MLISLSRLTELCGGNTEQAEKLHHVRLPLLTGSLHRIILAAGTPAPPPSPLLSPGVAIVLIFFYSLSFSLFLSLSFLFSGVVFRHKPAVLPSKLGSADLQRFSRFGTCFVVGAVHCCCPTADATGDGVFVFCVEEFVV